MKKPTYRIPLLFLFICTFLCAQLNAFAASKEYTLVVEAYDWGPNLFTFPFMAMSRI